MPPGTNEEDFREEDEGMNPLGVHSEEHSLPRTYLDDTIDTNENELSSEVVLRSLKLSVVEKVAVGSGHILNDLCASLWFSYLLLYFENVVQLSSDYAAYLMLLGQIVDGISTPLIGYEADSSNHCVFCRRNYGRCKSWHLFGIILVTLSFPFVFTPCIACDGADDWAKLIYYAPFIVIFQIGWASTQISHLALIPKMNPNELVRTELLAYRYAFTVASNITVFILAWQTFGFKTGDTIDQNDEKNFRNVAFMAVGIGLFFSIIFHIFVKEHPDDHVKRCVAVLNREKEKSRESQGAIIPPSANRTREEYNDGEESESLLSSDSSDVEVFSDRAAHLVRGEDSISIRDHFLSTTWLSLGKENMSIKEWLSMPQFYAVALVYMATRMSVNVTQVYVPLYLQKSLRLPSGTVATIPLTMYVFGFVVTIFIKLINKHAGRQLSYVFGAALTVGGAFCILFVDLHSQENLAQYKIYGVAALLGSGASAILITSLSITADLIGNNVESGAFIYGAMSFTDKLSCGFAVMFINSFVPCQKDDVKDCSAAEETSLGNFYELVLAFASGGCAIVGVIGVLLLTLVIFCKPSARREESMQRRIPSQNRLSC